jgi:hypothetical protein
MRRRFTQIKGMSETRRLPRLGKIRLGVRVKKAKADSRCKEKPCPGCNFCTYPREVPHFVVPPEVAKVYGPEPTVLDIMLPVNDPDVVFPQAFEHYGSGRGLTCTGDGERAMRVNKDTGELDEVPCPCPLLEQKKCGAKAHLMAILPKVSVGGVYQLDTGSWNSIVDINSSLDYVSALLQGRFAMVPLKLKREPRETFNPEAGKQTHYTLRVELEGNVDFINQLRGDSRAVLEGPGYTLPAPVIENPAFDAEGVTVNEADQHAGTRDDEQPEPTSGDEPPARDLEQVAADFLVAIADAADLEALDAIGKNIAKEPEQVQKVVRDAYRARGEKLAGGQAAA